MHLDKEIRGLPLAGQNLTNNFSYPVVPKLYYSIKNNEITTFFSIYFIYFCNTKELLTIQYNTCTTDNTYYACNTSNGHNTGNIPDTF